MSHPGGVCQTGPVAEGSSKQTCSNCISSRSLAANTCLLLHRWGGHWQDTGLRSEALLQDLAHILGSLPSSLWAHYTASEGVFVACTYFAEGQKPPWGLGQTTSGPVLSLSDTEVSGQPPSPDILWLLWEVLLCDSNG